jgi:hypothetical protein
MEMDLDGIRAVLTAYKLVKDASWPDLHPSMAQRSRAWATSSLPQLQAELAGYLAEASLPSCPVRVFWKLGPEYRFAGCNDHFARDAGLPDPAAMVGLDDFDQRLPWQAQAAKYRADDKEVWDSGAAKLDILERQTSSAGVTWVLVGKAPVRSGERSIGVLGMYQVLEKSAGQKLYLERSRAGR